MTGLKLTMVVMDVRKRKGREMDERKPHKWAEVIKAWADGKPIQCRVETQNEWIDWSPDQLRQSNASAMFFPFDVPRFDKFEWRVKPENFVFEECVYVSKTITEHGIKGSLEIANGSPRYKANIRLEFARDTYQLVKAEVI